MNGFEYKVRAHRNAIEVAPVGRVDSGRARGFESILMGLARGCREHLVLNLTDLTFVSSPGLRAILLSAHETRSKGDRHFLVCTPQPQIEDLLKTTGFDKRLEMRTARKAAIDELARTSVPAGR